MPSKKKKTKIVAKVKKPSKKLSLYDTDHPYRRTAIDIIKTVLEPLFQKGLNGKQFYSLEDSLTLAINRRLQHITKTPILPDLNETATRKILQDDHLDESDNDENDDTDYYDDTEEDYNQ